MKKVLLLFQILLISNLLVGQSGTGTIPFELRIHDLALPYSGTLGTDVITHLSGTIAHRTVADAYTYQNCQGTRLGFQNKGTVSDEVSFIMLISYQPNPADIALGTQVSNYSDWNLLTYGQPGYVNLTTDQDFFIAFSADPGFPNSGTIQNDIWYVKVEVEKGINLNAPTICPNQTTTLTANGCGLALANNTWDPVNYPGLLAYWSNGDLDVSQIIVTPSVTTNYQLITKTWVLSEIPGLGTNVYDYLLSTNYNTTVQVQVPYKPTIIGANTLCDNNNLYTIGNYQPSQSYTINVSHGIATTPNANGEFTVTWQNAPNPGVATITVTTATPLGCDAVTSFEVASCCNGSQPGDLDPPLVFVNATASQMLQSTNFNNANYQIVLNGVIKIDQNLTITGCDHIKLAPNAQIVIEPGKTLTINASKLAGDECQHMWKGIIVPDPTANINVQNSTIRDAYDAVWAMSNAEITAVNSIFSNNLIGLHFSDVQPKEVAGAIAPQANTSIIHGNSFNTNGSFLTPYPSTYKAETGIYANNIYNLQIGETGQNQNQFHNMYNAINSLNSYTVVENNKMYNLLASAIRFRNQLVTNSSGQVTFQIFSRLHALDNSFEGTMPNAIYGDGQLEAEGNAFLNRAGHSPTIWVREVASGSYVNDNTFTPQNGTNSTNNTVTAIKLERAKAPYKGMILNVKDNIINRYRSGIELTNTQSRLGRVIAGQTPIKVNVKDNTITTEDFYPNYGRNYGIRLQHGNAARIEDNIVELDNLNTDASRATTERGIAISQSQNAFVVNNEVKNYGNGIWSAGLLKGTYYGCNILQNTFYGFYFLPPNATSNTVISSQGTPTSTTQNRWIDPAASSGAFDRVAGEIDPGNVAPEWYYNNTPNLYDAGIQQGSDPTRIDGQGLNNVPQNGCTTATWWRGPVVYVGDREYEMGEIVRNQQQYQTLQQEFEQYGEEYLFEMLTSVPDILVTSDPNEDQVYIDWMDSISATNIAAFYAVMEALDSGNLQGAILINAQIVPQNSIEINRKTVNYFYLTKYVQGKVLAYEDSIALAPIALQTPYQGGDAVFGARVMLGIDPDDHGVAYKGQAITDKVKHESYKVYPNPATQSLTIEMTDVPFGESTRIILTDVLGNVVFNQKSNTSGYSTTIPLNLANGVYILNVNNGEHVLLTQRIIINK